MCLSLKPKAATSFLLKLAPKPQPRQVVVVQAVLVLVLVVQAALVVPAQAQAQAQVAQPVQVQGQGQVLQPVQVLQGRVLSLHHLQPWWAQAQWSLPPLPWQPIQAATAAAPTSMTTKMAPR